MMRKRLYQGVKAVLRRSPNIIGGESVWNREWDVLCVLDGCRADTFERVYDGDSDRLTSVASASPTWIARTLGDRGTSDVGCLTANPYAADLDRDAFAYFHLEPMRETDSGVETVPPDTLTARAVDVWRRRDELGVSKFIIHYMQPHAPFRSRPDLFARWSDTDTWGAPIWEALLDNSVRESELRAAYRDNLRWVLDEGVSVLAANCDATIGVTADHGNGVGEWGIYGHPVGAPTRAVREVPWTTIEARDTHQLSPEVSAEPRAVDVQRQLCALGYSRSG